MSEKLSVRNFGGIEQLDVDLSRINLFIGPQATGKSLCAKLLYYFKGFVHELLSAVEREQNRRELNRSLRSKFQDYFPPHTWGSSIFAVRYQLGDASIKVSGRNGGKPSLRLEYSDHYKKEFDRCRRHLKKRLKQYSGEAPQDLWKPRYDTRKEFYGHLADLLGEVAGFTQLFIPAGRSFFAVLQSGIFSFLSRNKGVDPFLTEFGSLYENVRDFPIGEFAPDQEGKALAQKVRALAEAILCGKHVRQKGTDYVVHPDGRRIALAHSSSGQQEMLPLAVILGVIPLVSFLGFAGGGNTVYIEEPEAHLFPTAQRKIVELIATVFNTSRLPLQFVITTHSPYIPTAFNNLILAGSLGARLPGDGKEALLSVVPAEQMVNPDNVRAYSLQDGTETSILDDETGLISAEYLDAVSHDLAVQYDKLLSLE